MAESTETGMVRGMVRSFARAGGTGSVPAGNERRFRTQKRLREGPVRDAVG